MDEWLVGLSKMLIDSVQLDCWLGLLNDGGRNCPTVVTHDAVNLDLMASAIDVDAMMIKGISQNEVTGKR